MSPEHFDHQRLLFNRQISSSDGKGTFIVHVGSSLLKEPSIAMMATMCFVGEYGRRPNMGNSTQI